MYTWHKNIKTVINLIESNLTEPLSLDWIAEKVNYSPYYCTKQFHEHAGITIRNYIRLRRLCEASLELRDTDQKIIDIAFKYKFQSTEAFSRAFKQTFGISPRSYRSFPQPLNLLIKRNVFDPYFLGLYPKKNYRINSLFKIDVNLTVVPRHKFIGIWLPGTTGYFNFWETLEKEKKRGCYEVCGYLESIKSYNGQIGGWFRSAGKSGYLYGIETDPSLDLELEDYLQTFIIPETLYIVFLCSQYDYLQDEQRVAESIREAVQSWDFREHGYERIEENLPVYQRHRPEKFGQAICIPVKPISGFPSF